jgi:hypothetical protein
MERSVKGLVLRTGWQVRLRREVYIYKKKHDEDPLSNDALRSAAKDVEEGRFHPEKRRKSSRAPLGMLNI